MIKQKILFQKDFGLRLNKQDIKASLFRPMGSIQQKAASALAMLSVPVLAAEQTQLLSGHLGTWYDSGAASTHGSLAEHYWGAELVLSRNFESDSLNLTLQSQNSLDSQNREIDCHLQWTHNLSDTLSLSLGLNNYFYSQNPENLSYHELEARIDKVFENLTTYFYLDHEIKEDAYLYAAAGASLNAVEICKGLTFTPALELSAILKTGAVYTETGVDKFSLMGTLSYQPDESLPALYLILSANWTAEPSDFSPGILIGLQKSF